MDKAVIYLRQSLDRDGSGAAVSRQREDCRRLAEQRGWVVVDEYVDNDVSATSSKPRPAYGRMLAAVERGEADVLIAWHIDRLTRKITDLEHLIELSNRTGLKVVTVNGDLDLTNDSGRLVGRILASVARGEVERKGARQRRAEQQAAEAGLPTGSRRPFGYGDDRITLVESEAAAIKDAYADLLAGSSLLSIARRWNAAEMTTTLGNKWHHGNVRSVLMNPRNAGLRAYKGEIVGKAVWAPIVDVDTYKRAVALLSAPERDTSKNRATKYLLPSIARCGRCGSDVATGHDKNGTRTYVCRERRDISRKAEPVDKYVEDLLLDRLSEPEVKRKLAASKKNDLREHYQRAAELQQRIDDLAVALEEGVLTLAAVRKSSARLRGELDAVEAVIAESTGSDALTPLMASDDVATAWKALDLAQKRAAVRAAMEITLLPPERGRQRFNSDRVKITWKEWSG